MPVDFNPFLRRHIHEFSDIVGVDWKFTQSAVKQSRETHDGGTSVIGDRVQSRADGTPALKNVIDKDDDLAVDGILVSKI